MKQLLAVFAFVAITLGVNAQTETTSQDFNIEITGETTRTDLSDLRQEFGDLGFDFQYQPSFDHDLRLVTIIVKLTEMNGEYKGSYESTQVQAGEVVTLRRVTDEAGKVTYCIGHCD